MFRNILMSVLGKTKGATKNNYPSQSFKLIQHFSSRALLKNRKLRKENLYSHIRKYVLHTQINHRTFPVY